MMKSANFFVMVLFCTKRKWSKIELQFKAEKAHK